jgi:hypothetical protein
MLVDFLKGATRTVWTIDRGWLGPGPLWYRDGGSVAVATSGPTRDTWTLLRIRVPGGEVQEMTRQRSCRSEGGHVSCFPVDVARELEGVQAPLGNDFNEGWLRMDAFSLSPLTRERILIDRSEYSIRSQDGSFQVSWPVQWTKNWWAASRVRADTPSYLMWLPCGRRLVCQSGFGHLWIIDRDTRKLCFLCDGVQPGWYDADLYSRGVEFVPFCCSEAGTNDVPAGASVDRDAAEKGSRPK